MVTAEVFSSITEAIHAEMLLVKHLQFHGKAGTSGLDYIYLFIYLFIHSLGCLVLAASSG